MLNAIFQTVKIKLLPYWTPTCSGVVHGNSGRICSFSVCLVQLLPSLVAESSVSPVVNGIKINNNLRPFGLELPVKTRRKNWRSNHTDELMMHTTLAGHVERVKVNPFQSDFLPWPLSHDGIGSFESSLCQRELSSF